MDLFCGTELAFSNSYFAPTRHSRIIKISTDAPVRSLTTAEIPPSAGSFSSSEGGLQSRFILWHAFSIGDHCFMGLTEFFAVIHCLRADGPNLFLNEFSLDRDLTDSSLCINFSQSLLIPGTELFIVRRKLLLLVVPTQSGIHRFYVHLTRHQDDSLGNYALISRLHEDGELCAHHEFHAWRTLSGSAAIGTKAALGTDAVGSTVAAVCMADRQLLRVTFLPPSPLTATSGGGLRGSGVTSAEETLLQTTGVLNRMFSSLKKQISGAAEARDVAVVVDDMGELVIYSAFRDAKIRSFSAGTCVQSGATSVSATSAPLSSIDLASLIVAHPAEPQPVDVQLKGCPVKGQRAHFLLVQMLLVDRSQFVVLKQSAGKLVKLFYTTLDNKYVLDFACTSTLIAGGRKCCLWAVVNESKASGDGSEMEEDQTEEPDGQPYTLKKCEFELLDQLGGDLQCSVMWENVRQATTHSASVDSLLFRYPDMEAVRNRIFDGNSYAFDVVVRAAQVACKQTIRPPLEHDNWVGLSHFCNDYCASRQFKLSYLMGTTGDVNIEQEDNTEEDINHNNSSMRSASPVLLLDAGDTSRAAVFEKFWTNLLKSCNNLQEEQLKPIAIWTASVPGLVGVIQMCRFTVYSPPDAQLRAISGPNNAVVHALFDLVKPNLNSHVKDCTKTLDIVNKHTDELCDLINAFVEHCSPKHNAKLHNCNSPLLNSSFTINLVAIALRARLLVRLRLAHTIKELLNTVPQLLSITVSNRTQPNLEMVIMERRARVAQMITYYSTMWIALSVRLLSSKSMMIRDQQSQRLVNVAQAFLKYGGPAMVKRFCGEFEEEEEHQQNADGEQQNGEKEEDDDDDSFVRGSDEEIPDDEDVSMDEQPSGCPPPSRWDDQQQRVPTTDTAATTTATMAAQPVPGATMPRFARFVEELLEGTIYALWPETSLTLPRFLAERKFFDALMSYCTMSARPVLPPELAHAFRFFQAIALSGKGDAEGAWCLFEQVAHGVAHEDEVLNAVLSQMYASPSTELSPPGVAAAQQRSAAKGAAAATTTTSTAAATLASANERRANNQQKQQRLYSLAEYYNKVMHVFWEHKHRDYVVQSGEKAVHLARAQDGADALSQESLELLISEIYTTMFTQHLLSAQYSQAVRTVLTNPNVQRQMVCLRQLIIHLLDKRQRRVLVSLPFDRLSPEVMHILEARCKAELINGAPNGTNPMYEVTFAFLISRCEFTRAAKLMYELAMRLRCEIQSRSMLQRRCAALATAYQTMQIDIDEPNISYEAAEYEDDHPPLTAPGTERLSVDGTVGEDDANEAAGRDFEMVDMQGEGRQTTGHQRVIPAGQQAMAQQQSRSRVIVTKEDVARQLLQAEARLALLDADAHMVPPLADEDILRESLSHKRFDMAWLLIKQFELKPYELLERVTEQAIRTDFDADDNDDAGERNEHGGVSSSSSFVGVEEAGGSSESKNAVDEAASEDTSFGERRKKKRIVDEELEELDWVVYNRQYLGDGGSHSAHWRLVISYLDLAIELFPHDAAILRTVANVFLKYSLKLPTWLESRYKRLYSGDLLRLLIDYDDLADAFSLLFTLIDAARQRLREFVARWICINPKATYIPDEELITFLPYTHINELLRLAEKRQDRQHLHINETVEKLKQFADFQKSITKNPIAFLK